MNIPIIVGTMETQAGGIYYADVLGIYADRGTPRKPGHWVKVADTVALKGVRKMYVEGLTYNQKRLLEAAARFNQVVSIMKLREL